MSCQIKNIPTSKNAGSPINLPQQNLSGNFCSIKNLIEVILILIIVVIIILAKK